ncbi:putative parvulin-type peptidyl-prolyl cis-trans isomerase precursor [mine drainage metagenome]|uniref:Putative parvulin-type peptidyl-prolyl cis-trans isomerase n=1 Tax=mine drainage metagenome TaxID=410659 RepID=A0A1J5QHJ1_9ZZZZ
MREQLINQTMMAQEARKTGLDKMPLVQAQVELAGQAVLARAWQQKVLSEVVVKDDQIKAEYAALIARLGKQEYLVRHLLVADESTAKLLIEKLQSGAKMADLAAQYSRDASTKDHGGLTDWTPAGNFLPPVADVVVKLEKGKVWPQAVHSNAGWHILQLEDKRPFTAPTMEAIKPQLTQLIARRELEAQAQALKAKAVVQ